MKRARLNPRKLLLASAGVATVNYAVAAGSACNTLIANLVLEPVDTSGSYPAVANLMPSPFVPEPLPAAVSDAAVSDVAVPDAAVSDAASSDPAVPGAASSDAAADATPEAGDGLP